MARFVTLLMLVLVVGCGADLTGTYSGTGLQVTTCVDGSSSSLNQSTTWVLKDSGDVIEIWLGGYCDPLLALGSSETAVIQPKVCPPLRSGSPITERLQAGNIGRSPAGISVAFELVASGSVSCTTTFNAELAKQ